MRFTDGGRTRKGDRDTFTTAAWDEPTEPAYYVVRDGRRFCGAEQGFRPARRGTPVVYGRALATVISAAHPGSILEPVKR